jgi:hypothetical protein
VVVDVVLEKKLNAIPTIATVMSSRRMVAITGDIPFIKTRWFDVVYKLNST